MAWAKIKPLPLMPWVCGLIEKPTCVGIFTKLADKWQQQMLDTHFAKCAPYESLVNGEDVHGND